MKLTKTRLREIIREIIFEINEAEFSRASKSSSVALSRDQRSQAKTDVVKAKAERERAKAERDKAKARKTDAEANKIK